MQHVTKSLAVHQPMFDGHFEQAAVFESLER